MATYLSGLNGASHVLHTNLKQISHQKPRPRTAIPCTSSEESHTQAVQTQSQTQETGRARTALQASRRTSLGFAAAAAAVFVQHFGAGACRADDEPANNGYWLTEFPLPTPKVTNKIANEATGTRSFLKNGIYMAKIGPEMSAYRLRQYAFDLLALEDLLGKNAWNYVKMYLCLKSTFMYYDFDKVISAAPGEQKQPLTDLANRLFDNVEKLEEAVKRKDDPATSACYADTKAVLQEVMARMA